MPFQMSFKIRKSDEREKAINPPNVIMKQFPYNSDPNLLERITVVAIVPKKKEVPIGRKWKRYLA